MTTPEILRRRYQSEAVTTASPSRLVIMLYDRLVKDLYAAHAAIGSADIPVAHHELVHAQEIVAELAGSLDVARWEEARSLASLYEYLGYTLVRANLAKSQSYVMDCLEVVEPLRDAFVTAAQTPDASQLRGVS
ncbi:flagellar export chaperone FliS [Nostocoides sp. HKS02]|uniref:flagellar export chaperone FliS n=1 Tax=Nostocoides sp. HKS02 TaxID=1813880 RepID=UPI001E5E60CA|nr:flagellar export chaperone FliS [Tetrasphaera sp. HKS02]